MILSLFLLFFMVLLISVALFYFFCFFLPALKMKYGGISDTLSSEIAYSEEYDMHGECNPDLSVMAKVLSDSVDQEKRRFFYNGEKSCRLFHNLYGSEYINSKVCIGFGDCIQSCPQNAISINDNQAVISSLCNGCGRCLDYCPEKIITLVAREENSNELDKKGFKFYSACYRLLFGGMKVC